MDSKLGAEGRKDLFDWLSRQLSGLSSFAEAAQLLKPASSAMAVRSDYSIKSVIIHNFLEFKFCDGSLAG